MYSGFSTSMMCGRELAAFVATAVA
jgi:hypothetical protein